ncbi:hypothetical protein C8F01DRAFT_1301361 [Mycena amicta]|nr:hypothetical protein C8F01DRAFT_1301361 [Mycena amicta]
MSRHSIEPCAGYIVRQESHLYTYAGAGYTPSHGHLSSVPGAAYREQDLLSRGHPSFQAENIDYYDPGTNDPRQRPMTMQPQVDAAYGANDYVPRNRPSESYSVQNAVNDRIPRPTTAPPLAQTVDPTRHSIRTYTRLVKGRPQDVTPPLPVRRRFLNDAPIATVPEVRLALVVHELNRGVHRPLKTAERQQKRIRGGGKR